VDKTHSEKNVLLKKEREEVMKKGVGVLIIFAVLFLSLPAVSYGRLITITITANVNHVGDSYSNLFNGKVSVGDPVTGTYTYDTSTTDTNPSNPDVGDYWHYAAPCGITINIGSFIFESDRNNVRFLLEVLNSPSQQDGYGIQSYNNICTSDSDIEVGRIGYGIFDSTGNSFSNDALPATLFNWDNAVLGIYGPRDGLYFEIKANVASVTLVPEPATLFLTVLGLIVIRKHKNLLNK
jgi:hypothetical protein